MWLPDGPGKFPVILLRTPYLKANHQFSSATINLPAWAKYFAEHGYAFVIQDVRGRGNSDGEFNFFFQEGHDGYDTIEALAAAPWSSGGV